jgi:exodeoxyribonuclease V alpha subunit
VERLTFADPDSHYAVVRLRVKGRRQPATVVGPLAAVKEGEALHLKGRYEVHPKWGEQFRVVWWYAVLPATVAGIEKYLASGLIKGIGPELAQRLVEHFGGETLTVIGEAPERLTEVSGIGPKKMDQIRRDWQTHKAAREVLVALQGLGVGMAMATKIYQQYGDQAVEVVTTNPYQLALDIHGLGFITADRLAGRLNLDPLTPARLAAGLLHLLDTMAGEGHVYVPEEELLRRTGELLRIGVPLSGWEWGEGQAPGLEQTEELLPAPRPPPEGSSGGPGPGRAGGAAGAAGRPGCVQAARVGGGNRGGSVSGTPADCLRDPPAAPSR